jgi:hypothetical protein
VSLKQDLERVGKDPAAGARLLLVAAEYLRRGEVLPSVLADHIAGAFEVAAHKVTEAERVVMLGRQLGLVRESAGRPKKATVDDARAVEFDLMFSDDVKWEGGLPWSILHPRIRNKLRVGATKADHLLKEMKELDERQLEGLRADMAAWCAVASPEQLEVFQRTDDMLDHDEAAALVAAFRSRESSSPGSA